MFQGPPNFGSELVDQLRIVGIYRNIEKNYQEIVNNCLGIVGIHKNAILDIAILIS